MEGNSKTRLMVELDVDVRPALQKLDELKRRVEELADKYEQLRQKAAPTGI
ncbi:MAG: hypothetical protein IMW99_03800 [Firmicutes bacterium]|nr:hypothetical protein [Bacillota bacterium]